MFGPDCIDTRLVEQFLIPFEENPNPTPIQSNSIQSNPILPISIQEMAAAGAAVQKLLFSSQAVLRSLIQSQLSSSTCRSVSHNMLYLSVLTDTDPTSQQPLTPSEVVIPTENSHPAALSLSVFYIWRIVQC